MNVDDFRFIPEDFRRKMQELYHKNPNMGMPEAAALIANELLTEKFEKIWVREIKSEGK